MTLLTTVSPDVWILIAGGLYTLGYLIINQAILRLMITAGSFAYLAYYFTAADEPLWGAITTTLIMMTANLIGLAALLMQNMEWTVPRAHRDIYPKLQPMLPGDFRALMRCATRYVVDEERMVTEMGKRVDKLYFVLSGDYKASKFGMTFQMQERTFVGEVAYLNNVDSAATTTFPAGIEILEWDRKEIKRRSAKSPRFKLALESLMSRDLARKVSFAVAPPTLDR